MIMKKAFLILSIFFVSISSSFAWTQVGMSANGYDENGYPAEVGNSMSININAYCDVLWFHGSLGNQNPDSYLDVGAYDSINGLSYSEFITPSGTFQKTVGYENANIYWGTVQIYMTIYNAWAQVVLEYGNIGRP